MDLNFHGSTLRDYITIIFRHKGVIITSFITVTASVLIGLELKTPMYESEVKMLISAEKQIDSPYYKLLAGYEQGEVSLTQCEIVTSNPVIERAVKTLKFYERPSDYEKNYCSALKKCLINLKSKMAGFQNASSENKSQNYEELEENQQVGISTTKNEITQTNAVNVPLYTFRQAVERLKNSVSVEPIKNTKLFTLYAYDFNPNAAAMIANVVSRSYIIFDLEQQLAELQLKYGEKQPIVVQLKDTIERMIKNLTGETLPDLEAIGPASVKIIEQALVPLKPIETRKMLSVVLAFFMSIFLGIMLAFGFEYVDQTFKSPQDLEKFLNLPVLGAIPKIIHNGKDSKQICINLHAFQPLADQIYLLVKDNNLKSILITALSPLEGSAKLIANLGKYLSQEAHHKIFIVDANLKAPSLHTIFNIPGKPGLADVLEEKATLEEATVKINDNLSILPAGETLLNPTTLLNSSRMRDVVNIAREKSELLFIEYANLRAIKNVRILSSIADGIVLVVSEGKTRRPVIKAAITPLEQSKANIIGTILNNRTFVIPKIIYKRL